MSSSFIVEPKDKSKKDDTLIIVVNDDGTISVDHETLQNIIINQSNANVSVVRLGQGDADGENGDITLTVDPPAYVPPEAASSGVTPGSTDTGVGGLVDPFMEMDPEQLERLETALQSEEAKQILGENVTAMLDMLSVEEEQNSLKYSIQLDHCYTSRKSPSDPKPSDPLPIAESPDINDAPYSSSSSSSSLPASTATSIPSSNITGTPTPTASVKGKLTKTGRGPGRPRKDGRPPGGTSTTPRSTGNVVARNATNVLQQGVNKGTSLEGAAEAPQSSSSESSESEPPSDDDSDFGPRGPRRSGVRARGGRKGLTTRGGSLAASRWRGSNKHMDMEQVRRLDMEMAAAVDAMKSPEKEDKSEDRLSPTKAKKNLKTFGAKKKEEPVPVTQIQSTEPEANVTEKPLMTTNQVKANLINANTIRGDMILTKPGQMKNNQKVIFVQKQVMMKASELKNLGMKKPVVVPKTNMVNQLNSKAGITREVKIQQPIASKVAAQPSPAAQTKVSSPTAQPVAPPQLVQTQIQQSQPQQQPTQKVPVAVTTSPTVKVKTPEAKKDKKKLEILTDIITPKFEVEAVKPAEPKTPDGNKKHQKRDHRKSPSHLVDALGPALFSTPDIIRRVGSGSEPKTPEALSTTSPATKNAPVSIAGVSGVPSSTIASNSGMLPAAATSPEAGPFSTISTLSVASVTEAKIDPENDTEDSMQNHLQLQLQVDNHSESMHEEDDKTDAKVPLAEELLSSIDAASHAVPSTEVLSTSVEQHLVPKTIVSESSGIEGEEHLLATLEMEASKHEEELLAEALLLQEELGVDLADHAALVDQTSTVTEALLPPVSFVPLAEAQSIQQQTSPIRSVSSLPATVSVSESNNKSKTTLREEKEPVQIVRGGRVITLPPIEAPATRSKRLLAKGSVAQRRIEVGKKSEKTIKFAIQHQEIPSKDEIESEMDEDDEDGDNSDSEDDPDRLWCICKRPHNNRFMICCDVCEDWFHGKCVHVSKAMGQQMEEKGIEWVCPNCIKKKTDDSKDASPGTPSEFLKLQRNSTELSGGQLPADLSEEISSPVQQTATLSQSPSADSLSAIVSQSPDAPSVILPGVTQCVVCKKEARNSSIYCSDACILTHAQESLTKDKPATPSPHPKSTKSSTPDAVKVKPDARVIVFERKSGKILTGTDAPTSSNLRTWLKENPTYEVVRPNNLNTLQIGGKTVTAIQTSGTEKMIKALQQASGKGQGQPKMVYAKIAGSKQTVLAPSSKKIVIVSSVQSPMAGLSSQGKQQVVQSRQTLLTPTLKNPTFSVKQSLASNRQQQAQQSQQQKNQAITITPATAKQTQNKKSDSKPSTSQQQQQQQSKIQFKSSPVAKRPEPEPIRLNIRKTLAELLTSRIKETEDLKLSDEEITELALNIELEMYKFFRDTGAKYKAKYRSLVFNIKDTKNLTLFRKIADRSLAPDAVVRLSPDEMASQELAEWREKETKHQLEMIKKNELDLMAQAKSIVVKTHKGEQIIENDGGIDHVDPKTPVQDIVTALNSGDGITSSTVDEEKDIVRNDKGKGKHDAKKSSSLVTYGDGSKKKDKEREKHDRSRSRSRRHHSRDSDSRSKTRERSRERERRSTRSKDSKRDKERERERDKDRERERDKEREKEKDKDKDKYKKSRSTSTRNRSRGRHRDYSSKENSKKEDDRTRDSTDSKRESSPAMPDKPTQIEDRLWRHIEDETTTTNTLDGNESDISDREPSSTVTIKTPDFNEELDKDKEEDEEEEKREKQPLLPQQQPPQQQQQQQQQQDEQVQDREPELEHETALSESSKGSSPLQTVWRGFVNMVDVAKFFITAQEVSGHARDLMEDLPDTVDVVGRISHETVWDYISKMKKTGSKEILVIRLTAANDEEKIPYITLYSYLNSRSRLGVVGNVSKNIKDFYIMPFSNQSVVPHVLLPLDGPGFEEHRPHLLLGIIVRNKRKRASIMPAIIPSKIAKKDAENSRSYTPPLIENIAKEDLTALKVDKQSVTQMTLESLNKAHVGMSRAAIMESVKISKIVPELSFKIGINSPSALAKQSINNDILQLKDDDDDGDEPYSPGGMDDDDDLSVNNLTKGQVLLDNITNISLSPTKNSTELQRKMDELNRQIEEQKQQIQNISSSFLGDATTTLPGLGLDPPGINDSEEAYSPTDTRSFTPPPPGIQKISQPILDKVSNITIPANLQEILANVKRQESSKIDSYLPSKPSATFLTSTNANAYQKTEKYSTTMYSKNPSGVLMAAAAAAAAVQEKLIPETQHQQQPPSTKENKSTLRSLSDLDLIKKAEEELAAVAAAAAAAASAVSSPTLTSPSTRTTQLISSLPINTAQVNPVSHIPASPVLLAPQQTTGSFNAEFPEGAKPATSSIPEPVKKNLTFDQPKPPGLEDEDFSLTFPIATPSPIVENSNSKKGTHSSKFVPKSGIVLSIKRKIGDETSPQSSTSSTSSTGKTPRTKSRWGQGPADKSQ